MPQERDRRSGGNGAPSRSSKPGGNYRNDVMPKRSTYSPPPLSPRAHMENRKPGNQDYHHHYPNAKDLRRNRGSGGTTTTTTTTKPVKKVADAINSMLGNRNDVVSQYDRDYLRNRQASIQFHNKKFRNPGSPLQSPMASPVMTYLGGGPDGMFQHSPRPYFYQSPRTLASQHPANKDKNSNSDTHNPNMNNENDNNDFKKQLAAQIAKMNNPDPEPLKNVSKEPSMDLSSALPPVPHTHIPSNRRPGGEGEHSCASTQVVNLPGQGSISSPTADDGHCSPPEKKKKKKKKKHTVEDDGASSTAVGESPEPEEEDEKSIADGAHYPKLSSGEEEEHSTPEKKKKKKKKKHTVEDDGVSSTAVGESPEPGEEDEKEMLDSAQENKSAEKKEEQEPDEEKENNKADATEYEELSPTETKVDVRAQDEDGEKIQKEEKNEGDEDEEQEEEEEEGKEEAQKQDTEKEKEKADATGHEEPSPEEEEKKESAVTPEKEEQEEEQRQHIPKQEEECPCVAPFWTDFRSSLDSSVATFVKAVKEKQSFDPSGEGAKKQGEQEEEEEEVEEEELNATGKKKNKEQDSFAQNHELYQEISSFAFSISSHLQHCYTKMTVCLQNSNTSQLRRGDGSSVKNRATENGQGGVGGGVAEEGDRLSSTVKTLDETPSEKKKKKQQLHHEKKREKEWHTELTDRTTVLFGHLSTLQSLLRDLDVMEKAEKERNKEEKKQKKQRRKSRMALMKREEEEKGGTTSVDGGEERQEELSSGDVDAPAGVQYPISARHTNRAGAGTGEDEHHDDDDDDDDDDDSSITCSSNGSTSPATAAVPAPPIGTNTTTTTATGGDGEEEEKATSESNSSSALNPFLLTPPAGMELLLSPRMAHGSNEEEKEKEEEGKPARAPTAICPSPPSGPRPSFLSANRGNPTTTTPAPKVAGEPPQQEEEGGGEVRHGSHPSSVRSSPSTTKKKKMVTDNENDHNNDDENDDDMEEEAQDSDLPTQTGTASPRVIIRAEETFASTSSAELLSTHGSVHSRSSSTERLRGELAGQEDILASSSSLNASDLSPHLSARRRYPSSETGGGNDGGSRQHVHPTGGGSGRYDAGDEEDNRNIHHHNGVGTSHEYQHHGKGRGGGARATRNFSSFSPHTPNSHRGSRTSPNAKSVPELPRQYGNNNDVESTFPPPTLSSHRSIPSTSAAEAVKDGGAGGTSTKLIVPSLQTMKGTGSPATSRPTVSLPPLHAFSSVPKSAHSKDAGKGNRRSVFPGHPDANKNSLSLPYINTSAETHLNSMKV